MSVNSPNPMLRTLIRVRGQRGPISRHAAEARGRPRIRKQNAQSVGCVLLAEVPQVFRWQMSGWHAYARPQRHPQERAMQSREYPQNAQWFRPKLQYPVYQGDSICSHAEYVRLIGWQTLPLPPHAGLAI